MPPGPWALATTTASSWRPTWAGSPWASSSSRSPPPGPQRRRDRRRPPPPRRSAAGPGEVLDALAHGLPLMSWPPPGRRPAHRGPGPGRRRENPHRRRTGWTGRRFPRGPCAIPHVGPVARRSGPPLWSSTSHFKGKWDTSAPGLAGDTRTMKTDKKGALRLQTHLWIARRLTGLAGPDYDDPISFGLPFESEDCQYGGSWLHGLAPSGKTPSASIARPE